MQPAWSVVRSFFAFLGWLLSTALLVDVARLMLSISAPLPELNRYWLWVGWAIVVACLAACIMMVAGRFAGEVTSFGRRVSMYVCASFVIVLAFELWQLQGLLVERHVDGPSMVPALVGRHWNLHCSQCGYRFAEPVVEGRRVTLCPLCHEPIRIAATQHANPLPGERVLIDRLSRFEGPRRWQIWAYRIPEDPHGGQLKRVVGLPGERVTLWEGDVWINGTIARKSLPQFLSGATLAYDSRYVNPRRQRLRHVDISAAHELADQPRPAGLDRAGIGAAGHRLPAHWWIFNGRGLLREPTDANSQPAKSLPAIEMILSQSFKPPDWRQGVELSPRMKSQSSNKATGDDPASSDAPQEALQTPIPDWPHRDWLWESQLEAPSDAVLWWCYLGPAGRWAIQVALSTGQWSIESTAGTIIQSGTFSGQIPLKSTWYFGFFDNQLLLVAGGKEIVRHELITYQGDGPAGRSREVWPTVGRMNATAHRVFRTTSPLPLRPGDLLALGSPSSGVKVNRVRIWRDVYYVDPGGRGALWSSLPLGHGEYFLLGDNAANSLDSRQLGPIRRGWLLGQVLRCR